MHLFWHCACCEYTLKHTAAICSTLQHTATHPIYLRIYRCQHRASIRRVQTLQHTTAHCNTLLYTAIHCDTLQPTTAHYSTLPHSATHCSTQINNILPIQHTATLCHTLQNTDQQHLACCKYMHRADQHVPNQAHTTYTRAYFVDDHNNPHASYTLEGV